MFVCQTCDEWIDNKWNSQKSMVHSSSNTDDISYHNVETTTSAVTDCSKTDAETSTEVINVELEDVGASQPISAVKSLQQTDSSTNLDKVDRSERLLHDVGDKVKALLHEFEGTLMLKVDKILKERSLGWGDQSTSSRIVSPQQRTPTPSSSSMVSDNSLLLGDTSPLTPNCHTSAFSSDSHTGVSSNRSYLAALKTPHHVMSPDSSVSTAKKTSTGESGPVESTYGDHVLVLHKNGDDADILAMEKCADKALTNVPVNFQRTNKNSGKIVIYFPSNANKEEGRKQLTVSTEASAQRMIVREPKKMLPKITVPNIPNSILSPLQGDKPSSTMAEYRNKAKELLESKFLEKNSELQTLVSAQNHVFKIVFLNTTGDSSTVGIKVSPTIRDLLINKGRIYIGNTSCKVLDRFDLKQCFRCQRLGHISSQCRDNVPVCMYCSASHLTKDCAEKRNVAAHRCVNCSHSSSLASQQSYHTHHSGSESCPIIIAEKQIIRSRTEYSKNV